MRIKGDIEVTFKVTMIFVVSHEYFEEKQVKSELN